MTKELRNSGDVSEVKAPAKTPFANRMLWILVGVTLIISAVHLLFQYLNIVVFYQQVGQFYELSNRFDLDDESSVPTWFSQALFLAIGVSAFLAGYLQTNKPARLLWWMIATIGLLFSIDEISMLHEHVLQSIHVIFFQEASPTGLANAWWVVVPFVLMASAWLIWRMLHLLPRRTLLLFVLSGVVFLSGAIFVDMLASTAPRETYLNQGIYIAIEETLEFLGTVLGFYAIVSYLETYHHAAISRAIKQLRLANSRER